MPARSRAPERSPLAVTPLPLAPLALLLCAAVWLAAALLLAAALPPGAAAGTTPASGTLRHWSVLGTDKLDSYMDVAPKPGGGGYACGATDGTWSEPSDLLIARFTAAGGVKWQHSWDSGDLLGDAARIVKADRYGNAIVLGSTTRSETGSDWVILKYSPAGGLLWQRVFDGAGDDTDEARDLAVDDAGNVYVTGSTTHLDASVWMRTVKYRGTDGKQLWRCEYGGPAPYAYGESVVVDAAHNVYVAGWQKTASAGLDAVVMRISPSGKRLWTRSWDGGGVNGDSADRLALDGKGGLRVLVRSWSVAHGQDWVLIKYDTRGHRRWVRRWDGAAHKDDLATALAVDGQGNAVVVGHTETVASEPGVKGAVVKWDAAGHRQWYRTFHDGSLEAASFHDVVTAATGSIWVGGMKNADANTSNALVVKFSPRGKRLWVRLWSQPSPSSPRNDRVGALALSGPSTLWAAGLAGGQTTLDDAMLLKYVR